MRILYVEDEQELRVLLQKRLQKEYSVDACEDGEMALDYLKVYTYEIVILDIMLPKINGLEVLKWMRGNKIATPVILLTAKDSIKDRVTGLDNGADDYLVKPFAYDELLARIRALTRRKSNHLTSYLQVGDLVMDLASHTVTRAGNIIQLTSKEYRILEYMMHHPNILLSRAQLEEQAWDSSFEGGSNIVDVYIRYLRKKIDDGVMLSIYDSDFQMTNGILPDEFPQDIPFVENGVRKVKSEEENWFVNDCKVIIPEVGEIWIRGVHSYSSIIVMIQRLTLLMCVIFPILILFTAFTGYRMIRRCLKPVQTITDTANEITITSALNRRIPLPDSTDEFYHLSNTFNQMFERLEDNFLKERQFSSDAAHELRTPLAVILSHCEYCLDELQLEPEMKREMHIIKQKAEHMSELVLHLLTISREERRLSSPEYEWVDLQLLAESVAEELEEKAAEKEIEIHVISHLENPILRADMSMLTRLFMNLVNNAITYGREQGYVKILMEDKEQTVCLKFEDNGIGIAKEACLLWKFRKCKNACNLSII